MVSATPIVELRTTFIMGSLCSWPIETSGNNLPPLRRHWRIVLVKFPVITVVAVKFPVLLCIQYPVLGTQFSVISS